MPETVELYGVAWEVLGDGYMHTVDRGGYSFNPTNGGTLRYAFGDQIADCSEDRAAMIVALLARPGAQFELVEWQSIETAPKDGSEVILKDAKGRKESTFWAENEDGSAGWAEAWNDEYGVYFFYPEECEFVDWAPGIENDKESDDD